MRIKSITTTSAGKTLAMSTVVVAFIIGLVRSLAWLVFDTGRGRRGGADFDDTVFGPFAFVALPLFFGAIAFVVGFVLAVVYNIAAGITGGLDLDVEGDDADAAKRGKELDW